MIKVFDSQYWYIIHRPSRSADQTLTTLKIKRCKQIDLKQRKQKQQEKNQLILLIDAIYGSNIIFVTVCHMIKQICLKYV